MFMLAFVAVLSLPPSTPKPGTLTGCSAPVALVQGSGTVRVCEVTK